jgi:transposase
MGDLSDFQRRQIAGARLAGPSVTKTATPLAVSRAAVPKVVTAYTDHGKTSSAERNCGRQPKLSERDRRTLKRIASKNYRTAAVKVTAELNTHPKDPFSTKTVRRELHKSNIHGRPAIAKPLITESNAKRRKRWCDDPFTLFPT